MKRTLTALALATALTFAFPASASAGVDTVGWFTRNPAASAPDGGLQVANAPDGVVSYGAISVFEDGDSITSATLTLKEAGNNVNASGAAIQACPAAGSFPAGKGDLEAGPKADCLVGKVALKRSAEGVWTGDVTPLLKGDSPAVAVVPADGSPLFQVSFAPPALDVVADEESGSGSGIDSSFDAGEFGGTSGGGGDSSSSGGGFDGSSGSGSTFDSGSSGSSGSFDSGSGGSSFSPSPSFGAAPAAPAVTATTAGGEPLATDAEATAEPEVSGETAMPTRRRLAGQAASTSSSGGSGKQYAFFVLSAAVIGAGAGFGRNRLVTSRA